MQNRFGLKDFVLFLLIIGLGVVLVLQMIQHDRSWGRMQDVLSKVTSLESQLNRVEEKFDKGVAAAAPPSAPAAVSGGPSTGAGASAAVSAPSAPASPSTRDESWARAGAPVQWQPEPVYFTDPSGSQGFKAGGDVTEIFEAQTKVVTPYISTDVYSRRIQETVLESLGALNPKTLKMQGALAEAWQVDPNGLWLRARLRANVRFSDGQPVTTEDIRWTFHDYVMNEQIEAERNRSILRDSIEEVKVIDARTVEFTFKERLFTNVDNALSLFVLPKHFYSKFSPAQLNQSTGLLMGSGPFKMRDLSADKQWSPPAIIALERNEQYWGPKAPLAAMKYQAINEEIARLNAFAGGDGDIITPSAAQFMAKRDEEAWQKRANFLNWVNMRSGYSFIAWNCDKRNGKPTPFGDKRVRQAMTMLLDREKMIRDIWKGIGVVAKGQMPLASPGSNPDVKPWPYDTKRALALLKEVGWDDRNGDGVLEDALGNEFQFEYSYASGSEISERIARFVKDAYSAAGIKVTLRSADWSVYQEFMKKRDFDAITLGWGANAPESDPKQIFHSASIKNQGDNFAQWNSPEGDKLIDDGRREMDNDKRMAIWRKLEAHLAEEQPYTFIRVPPWLRFVNLEVGNVTTYPAGMQYSEFFRAAGPLAPMPSN